VFVTSRFDVVRALVDGVVVSTVEARRVLVVGTPVRIFVGNLVGLLVGTNVGDFVEPWGGCVGDGF
jgi:hypothetical protein